MTVRNPLTQALDILDEAVDENGIKVAVKPDTTELDAWAWAKANPVPTVIGTVLLILVVRKLL